MEDILHLNAGKHPKIAESITTLNQWDRTTETDNDAASLVALVVKFLLEMLEEEDRLFRQNVLTEEEMVKIITKAQKHLKRHFGKVQVPLGEMQFHVRGDVALPVGGTPDVLAAMYTKPWKKGKFHSFVGDSYIQLVRFSEEGVELETVNAFGASNKPDSPHYTDQMQLYVNQQTKPMTLDKETILKNAVRVYYPGEEK